MTSYRVVTMVDDQVAKAAWFAKLDLPLGASRDKLDILGTNRKERKSAAEAKHAWLAKLDKPVYGENAKKYIREMEKQHTEESRRMWMAKLDKLR
jgi:hypothetical protein